MIAIARKLLDLLDRRERLQLALLFVAVVVMAFLQMASIAAILPFLSVAADPLLIDGNRWLSWAYHAFGSSSTNRFLIVLGALALAALVISNAWMAATQWSLYRFVRGRAHALSVKLMAHYLSQPYVWFLRRNSTDLGKNVLVEVEQVAGHVLLPGLQATSRAVVTVAVVGLLIAFDPLLAVIVTVVLGSAFATVWLAVRRTLSRMGKERLAANTERHSAATEAFAGIKDLKVLGKEQAFLSRLCAPSERVNRAIAGSQVTAELPRYLLEVFAFGGVLLLAITLLVRGGGLQQVIPVLGLYVFAGYRLMPMLQQIFLGAARVRFGAAALDSLHFELVGRPEAPALAGERPAPLPLADRLSLDGVTFTYPGAQKPALDDVSLEIRAATTVGIMGATGSGKTTLADVIIGLLRPQRGELRIDGVPLSEENLRAWQANVGYVPQQVFLSDDTIAANIALGAAPDEIDMTAVKRAAKLAQLHDFVAGELPDGYSTVVGDRGIRLSGGQRQRIAIARALYHDPAVLVFDEATSSLDNETEAAVMQAVERLAGTRTIIMIAHRLTTLRGCHEVFRAQWGRVQPMAPSARRVAPVLSDAC